MGDFFVSTVFQDLQRCEFLNLYLKSIWWEVDQCTSNFFLYFLIFFSKKYTKFSFCIDTNSHVLPTYKFSCYNQIATYIKPGSSAEDPSDDLSAYL